MPTGACAASLGRVRRRASRRTWRPGGLDPATTHDTGAHGRLDQSSTASSSGQTLQSHAERHRRWQPFRSRTRHRPHVSPLPDASTVPSGGTHRPAGPSSLDRCGMGSPGWVRAGARGGWVFPHRGSPVARRLTAYAAGAWVVRLTSTPRESSGTRPNARNSETHERPTRTPRPRSRWRRRRRGTARRAPRPLRAPLRARRRCR